MVMISNAPDTDKQHWSKNSKRCVCKADKDVVDYDQSHILFFRSGPWYVCCRSYSKYEGVSGLRPRLGAAHLQSVHQ